MQKDNTSVQHFPLLNSCFLIYREAMPKKSAPHFQRSAFVPRKDALINFDKVRIARANHTFRVDKAVHVNRDPAAVHKDEVGIPDQPEMVRPKSLDEELLRMPPKTKHFTVTRSELLLVHSRFLARARTRSSFAPVHVLSATLNIGLSTYVCVRLRFCLRVVRLLRGAHVLLFRRRCRLRFARLPRRLLRLRRLA